MNRRKARSVCRARRARTIRDRMIAGVLVVWGLMSLVLLALHASDLFVLDEAGYGDSYVLYDVLHFQKTGVIYRDLSQPPYLPTSYSPMVYVLYSIPGRIAVSENPFVGPRVVALTSFALCVGMVVSIVRTLLPRAGDWGLLLSCSIASMWAWVLQLRGDFPGILLNLLAIRLLLSRSPAAVPLAGICAGLAMHFKIIFVAALATGALWLLAQRRWRDLATFAVLGAISSGGLYLFFDAREPRMLSQMFASSPGIVDVRGCVTLMRQAGGELVVPLAILGLSSVAFRGPRWTLVVAFAVTSFILAAVFDLQAGGNVNYFFEALFAAVPLAVLGVIRLMALARRKVIVGVAAVAVLLIFFCVPRTLKAYQLLRARFETGSDVTSRNQAFRALEQTLRGRRIFSTVPRLALFDPAPALTLPHLVSYQERLGKFDPWPILERVQNSEFDVVITLAQPGSWRGVLHIAPNLRAAIAASYRPHCVVRGSMMHLPRRPRRDSSGLARDLARIGCLAVPPEGAGVSSSW